MGIYLVTGAAGFIGSHLAKRLIDEGHRVITIDNLSTGSLENIPNGVELYIGNCQDEKVYQLIPKEKYNAIFHIAGQSSGEISFDNPIYDLETNTKSTLMLLKFSLEVECSRLIYASSMSVYGDYLHGMVDESKILAPKSFYAVGKLASEYYLRMYERYGIRSTSLRFFNVYGPGQNLMNLRQGMASIYLAQMFQCGAIHVRGSKDRFRDFVYIDDAIDACLLCLSKENSKNTILNIASGRRTYVFELVEKLIQLYGKKVIVRYDGATPGDTFGVYADISKAKNLLGFSPKYSLEDGLVKMIEWAKLFYRVNEKV